MRYFICTVFFIFATLPSFAGDKLLEINTPVGEITSIAFSPDVKYIACGGWRKIYIYDMHSGEALMSFKIDDGSTVYDVAFTGDSSSIISTSGKVLSIYHLARNAVTFSVTADSDLFRMAYSQRTNTIVVGTKSILTAYNCANGKKIYEIMLKMPAESIVVSSDGKKLLVSPEWGQSVLVFNGQTGEFERELSQVRRAQAMRFLAGSEEVIMVSMPWKLSSVSMSDEIRMSFIAKGASSALDVFPDGKLVAIGTWLADGNEFVHLYSLRDQKAIKSFGPFLKPVYEVVFSIDGKHLGACFKDSVVRVWELQ